MYLVIILLFTSSLATAGPVFQPTDKKSQQATSPGISPYVGQWRFFGLDECWVTTLTTTDEYIYAGTFENGVFRKNLTQSNANWEYLGFKDIEVKNKEKDDDYRQNGIGMVDGDAGA